MLALLLSLAAIAAPSPAVTFDRDGGFAGRQERVVVSTSGHVTISQRRVVTRRLVLTAAQRRTLRSALATADLAHAGSAAPSDCADCYGYSVRSGGHVARATEGSVPRRLGPIVAFFEGLLNPLDSR